MFIVKVSWTFFRRKSSIRSIFAYRESSGHLFLPFYCEYIRFSIFTIWGSVVDPIVS